MPGGGPAYTKPLTEFGNVELVLTAAVRVAATTMIAILFGSIAFNPTSVSSARVFVGTIGFLLFAMFAVQTIACYVEVWRRCRVRNQDHARAAASQSRQK
jgi:hypothetical protein